MAWIDYKKASDIVPQCWIGECLEMSGDVNNVQDFLNNSMKSWKVELNTSMGKFEEIDISRGIIQGGSLSPLFVLCMILLTWLLNELWMGQQGIKIESLVYGWPENVYQK